LARVITHESVAQIRGRNGRIVSRHKDGTFHMPSDVAARAVKGGEATLVPELGPARKGVGYVCKDCGWGSYFVRCGRCGGECSKDA
jgi:hypothetical protein